jgi:hypothetical protein
MSIALTKIKNAILMLGYLAASTPSKASLPSNEILRWQTQAKRIGHRFIASLFAAADHIIRLPGFKELS